MSTLREAAESAATLHDRSPPLKVTVQVLRGVDAWMNAILQVDVIGIVGQVADSGCHVEILSSAQPLKSHELRHAKRMLEEKWRAMKAAERKP